MSRGLMGFWQMRWGWGRYVVFLLYDFLIPFFQIRSKRDNSERYNENQR